MVRRAGLLVVFLVSGALCDGFCGRARAQTSAPAAETGRYEHPRMGFSVELGGRWRAFDHRHAQELDRAIEDWAPEKGSQVYEGRWKDIYPGEREAIVAGYQGAYLLPVGDWAPPGSETRILITTRVNQCFTMEGLQDDATFEQRLVRWMTPHHRRPGGGQKEVLWEKLTLRYLDEDAPEPELPTWILRGTVVRENGERLAVHYQGLPGGDRFFRIKAVCKEEALPQLRAELDRLVASFGGLAPARHQLLPQFLRYLPIGAGLLLALLFLQHMRIRRDDDKARAERRAKREAEES